MTNEIFAALLLMFDETVFKNHNFYVLFGIKHKLFFLSE